MFENRYNREFFSIGSVVFCWLFYRGDYIWQLSQTPTDVVLLTIPSIFRALKYELYTFIFDAIEATKRNALPASSSHPWLLGTLWLCVVLE